MERQKLARYLVEIDEARGRFSILQTCWKNLRDGVLTLAVCVFCGSMGVVMASPWNWTFAIPVAQWHWHHALIFISLSLLVIVMGVVFLVVAFGGLYEAALRAFRGFPPVVLDRVKKTYRDSAGRVFQIDGLDSVLVAEKGGGEGAVYYTLDFHFRDGKPHELERSAARSRASCTVLGMAIARFLNVPIKGIESVEEAARYNLPVLPTTEIPLQPK
jgi:hypothetical protein